MEALRIALLGGGTVGSAFYALVEARKNLLRAYGVEPEFLFVLVRDPRKPRSIPSHLLTATPGDLLEADLVVEALGGVERPLELVLPALEAGIPLITANKALLVEAWSRLRPYLEEGLVYAEASVMAGTPALGALEVLRGSEILELHGILNGTTLYILRRMEEGLSYEAALREAQALGYAEADPRLDVEGWDAAHKLTLLARLLVDPDLPWPIPTRGIAGLPQEALAQALAQGGRVRLLASLYPQGGRWQAQVRPVRLPQDHPLAQSPGNALWVRSEPLGEVFLMGPGAGGGATASGLFADLLRFLGGGLGHRPLPLAQPVPGHAPTLFPEVGDA